MRVLHASPGICLAIFVALAMAADAQATIYYVNPTGSDTNAGTTVVTPFKTIKKAATVINSGDTVYVAAGTYTDEIVVNGVQGTSLSTSFIGSTGATVDAEWRVTNCNYLQIKGFTFRDGGAAGRLLVWKGSYEGLIQDCKFDTGRESLLIKSGSLTIERSQITNFYQNGLQVDGESQLVVRDSTISGCQQSGLQIRKLANVVFENCTVKDNLGSGVEVNVTADSIDPGPDGGGRWQGPVPLAGADGAVSISGGGKIFGDLYLLPQDYVSPSDVSGTIYKLPSGTSFPPIAVGNAATNNNNAAIPRTDKDRIALNAAKVFDLGSTDGVTLPPGIYYFTSLNCNPSSELRVSGDTTIYVTGNVDWKGSVNATGACGNLKIYALGTLVDISSQAQVKAAIYAPDATVLMRGGSSVEGMVIASSIDMAGSSSITTNAALQPLAATLLPAPPTSPSPPASWQPVSSGSLDISGSALTKNGNGVQVLTKQPFSTRATDFSQNASWGLSLFGACRVEACTLNSNAIGGVRLQSIATSDLTVSNLTLANNTQYGVFAADCNLTFNSTNIGNWKISGSQIAIMGQASNLTFDQVTMSGGSVAAVQANQGTLQAQRTTFSNSGYGLSVSNANATLSDCIFTGNTAGLCANQNMSLSVRNSAFTNNSAWGAVVYGGGSAGATTLEGCDIHHNPGGLLIVNAVDGQVLLRGGTALRDNTSVGLHFDGCNMTVNDQAAQGWKITKNNYGISSNNSTLQLDGITGDGNSYGAWLTSSTVTLKNSKFTGGTHGLWGTNNNSLSVDASTFTGNSSYGVYLEGPGSLHNCTITGNGSGLYLNTADVTDATLTGTKISDNVLYGVYAYNGSLALSTQATSGWSIDGNGYNIAGYQANISLTGINMTNATTYGVHAQYGSLDLQQSTISSKLGGVAGVDTTAFTVDRSRISGANPGSWGVTSQNGGLVLRNTVVSGAQSGVYSSGTAKPATIYNSTIADASGYGLYVENGDVTVKNTIISGTGGAYGIYRGTFANLVHSYNLVSGFAAAFENTTADATELLDPPGFADAARGDYSLAKGSPAINSGTDLSVSHTIDLQGNSRPSHKLFEIGAYEYMPNGGSVRVLGWREER